MTERHTNHITAESWLSRLCLLLVLDAGTTRLVVRTFDDDEVQVTEMTVGEMLRRLRRSIGERAAA